jgi:hypothetical protein
VPQTQQKTGFFCWRCGTLFLIYYHALDLGGIFTLQIQPDSGALIQFAFANQLPYTAPLSAGFALFLSIMSMLAIVVRSNIHLRTVRFAFIMSFVLNSSAFFMLQRVAMNSVSFFGIKGENNS